MIDIFFSVLEDTVINAKTDLISIHEYASNLITDEAVISEIVSLSYLVAHSRTENILQKEQNRKALKELVTYMMNLAPDEPWLQRREYYLHVDQICEGEGITAKDEVVTLGVLASTITSCLKEVGSTNTLLIYENR